MFQEAIKNYLNRHNYPEINLKAVLFDMDGVLFDSMKNHAAAWQEAMKRYGMNMSREEALPARRKNRGGNDKHRQPARKRTSGNRTGSKGNLSDKK